MGAGGERASPLWNPWGWLWYGPPLLVWLMVARAATGGLSEGAEQIASGCGAAPTPAQVCGATALADFAFLYGVKVPEEKIQRIADAQGGRPMSLLQIQEELRALGIETRGFSAGYDDIARLDRPVIAQLAMPEGNHFTVVDQAGEQYVRYLEEGQFAVGAARDFRQWLAGPILCAWGPGDSPEHLRHPALVVEDPFVEVQPGPDGVVRAELWLRNAGAHPLQVKPWALSAGWHFGPSALPAKMAPGERRRVEIVQRPAAAPDGKPLREQLDETETVLIASEDPVRPRRAVTVRVVREPPVQVFPTYVDLGEGTPEVIAQRERTVMVRYLGEPGELYLEPQEPWLQVGLVGESMPPATAWGERWTHAEVAFGVVPELLPPGDRTTRVAISTARQRGGSSQPAPAIEVRVSAWPRLRALPDELFFGLVGPGEVVVRSAEILGAKGAEVALQLGRPLPAALQAKVVRGEGGRPELQVTAHGDNLPPGVSEGEVAVTVSRPGVGPETLTVPFYACRTSASEVVLASGGPSTEAGKEE